MIDMLTPECHALLATARVGRLSMIDADGRPYTIPLRFLFHNGTVYMRLAHAGRKGDALAHDPRVCFESDAFTPDFSDYASVLMEGTVVDVTDATEKEEALFRFYEKYAKLCGTGVPPRPVTITGVALRKLEAKTISGRKREPDEAPGQAGPREAAAKPPLSTLSLIAPKTRVRARVGTPRAPRKPRWGR